METGKLFFRYEPRTSDREQIRRIVESTGFFFPYEVDVAVALLETRLEEGESASGYSFVFAEKSPRQSMESSPSQGSTTPTSATPTSEPQLHVVGYACFGPIACTQSSYDLFWIAVENSGQRRGIGKKILTHVEQRIREAGGKRVYVETSNRDQYRPTRTFYESAGYKKEAVLIDFYAPGDDKVIYVRALNE